MKIARGGEIWLVFGGAFTVLFIVGAFFFSDTLHFLSIFFSILSGVVTIILLIFFRDPERDTADDIVAVADGKIRAIEDIIIENKKYVQISTFMNIFDVHVNRAPFDGHVIEVIWLPGSFIPAYKKESERNERVKITLDTAIGKIYIVLIAGTVARRIVPYLRKNDEVNKGDRIGLIRLGSRVDIYLPKKRVAPMVTVKDRVHAGGDRIARIND